MAKGKQGFFQSIRKYRHYLNKKKESSKIMADLRKAEDEARTKFDDLNNKMNPLQVDLKAKNAHLQTLQNGMTQIDDEINKYMDILLDPTPNPQGKRLAKAQLIRLRDAKTKLTPSIATTQNEVTGLQSNINNLTPDWQKAQKELKNASGEVTYRTNYFNNFDEPSRTVRAIGYTLENPWDVAKNAATYVGLPYGAYLWGNRSGDTPAQTPNPNTGSAAPTNTGNPPPPGVPPQGATELGLPPGQGNVGVATGTTPPPDVQNSGETLPMHRTNAFEDALRAKLARDRIKAYQESKQ